MTGNELKTLMRRHKMTIRDLAKRTQITQQRIRLRRETGLDPETARDWIQAITGVDPGSRPQTERNRS
jgi:transcriptional regulator with XRE-family HTH domain